MARTKKDNRKRRLGYVLGSLDRTMEHGLEIVAEFNDALKLDPSNAEYDEMLSELAFESTHAKLAMLLNMAMAMTLQAQQTFEAFAVHAYGKVPDKVERWTSTGEDWRKKQGMESKQE